jgi:hypothetical protein
MQQSFNVLISYIQYIEGLLHLLAFFIHLKKMHGPKCKNIPKRFLLRVRSTASSFKFQRLVSFPEGQTVTANVFFFVFSSLLSSFK